MDTWRCKKCTSILNDAFSFFCLSWLILQHVPETLRTDFAKRHENLMALNRKSLTFLWSFNHICTLHSLLDVVPKRVGEKIIFFAQNKLVINRPGVAGAVLQTSSLLTYSRSELAILPFQYIQNTFTPKLSELATWHFERIFNSLHLSHFTCEQFQDLCDTYVQW